MWAWVTADSSCLQIASTIECLHVVQVVWSACHQECSCQPLALFPSLCSQGDQGAQVPQWTCQFVGPGYRAGWALPEYSPPSPAQESQGQIRKGVPVFSSLCICLGSESGIPAPESSGGREGGLWRRHGPCAG